jgi:hypothetical protein
MMTSVFCVDLIDFNRKINFYIFVVPSFTFLFSLDLSIFLEFLLAGLGFSHREISLGGPVRNPRSILLLLVFGHRTDLVFSLRCFSLRFGACCSLCRLDLYFAWFFIPAQGFSLKLRFLYPTVILAARAGAAAEFIFVRFIFRYRWATSSVPPARVSSVGRPTGLSPHLLMSSPACESRRRLHADFCFG